MNVEIGAEAALFPEKEYINGIAVAVQQIWYISTTLHNPRKNLSCLPFLNRHDFAKSCEDFFS
jgi:hypothetical protein